MADEPSFTTISLYVVIGFPKLIASVRAQGGSQLVISRLRYQRRLTSYRVRAVFRLRPLGVDFELGRS
jgi:hypothetical protein